MTSFKKTSPQDNTKSCSLTLRSFYTFAESMLNLPYYMPEPKSIDQFFKRRPRPEGCAMALLKYAIKSITNELIDLLYMFIQ